ncbi:hypothetical protein ACFP7A_03550 [Sporolactobacillus kofuensis]|uniref:Uncharacterized protein n=1 Tax=Sporolactobacillus kofuensis TaxID=269672 RepID=A0ABW1WET7_9BACL|nr:hypothetical protein [Sporolactobacillus kofuensis]MCO7174525.1 hypothetical protein [Sporolactobacillus kofuensis]
MDEERLKEIEQRLNAMDRQLQALQAAHHRPLIGSNIWVLVPVIAIIMWGLKGIF